MKLPIKMTLAILGILLGTLLMLGVSSAKAAQVIFSGNTATAIENLKVGEKFYDVQFVFQSADSVYGNPPVFTFDNQFEADAAVEAVRTAVNGVPAVTDVGPSKMPSFLIGYSETLVFTESRQGMYIENSWINTGYDIDEADDAKSFAVFTVAGTPTCTDNDGDSFAVEGGACGLVDCNDNDSNINPGAIEVCDDIDNNCNGIIDGGNVCTNNPTNVIYSGNTATGIQNLMVDGSFYNVQFVYQSADSVYGNPPVFTFDNQFEADTAVEAVRAALNGVPTVTDVGPSKMPSFLIGYSETLVGGTVRFTNSWQGMYIENSWINSDFDTDEADDIKSYAVFTPVSQPPSCTDNDGDWFAVEGGACGTVDCNDGDPAINPNAIEVCDGIDNNCNGIIDGIIAGGDVCVDGQGKGWLQAIYLLLLSD